MRSSYDDILELFDYVWQRFRDRMRGLADDEWRWQPVTDDRVTIRWRLDHIRDLLSEDRNAHWLGVPAESCHWPEVTTADEALAQAEQAYAHWRTLLTAMTVESFARPIGRAAGPHGAATRRSFALHIADELIHHTAEVALLRDLYH